MAADFKILYPATDEDTVDLTIGLDATPLASDANLLAGRESAEVDNTINLDLDHLLTGFITVGTSPTINTRIEIWIAAPRDISGGTRIWPDVLDGTDSDETLLSNGIKFSSLRVGHAIDVDAATSDRPYPFAPFSIAALFGGVMPPWWLAFVTHNTGVALNTTAANHKLTYHRIQQQSV